MRLKPPVGKIKPTKVYFGKNPSNPTEFRGVDAMDPPRSITDNYFWMRDDTRQDERVLSHIRAENSYAEQQMQPLKGLQQSVYESMLGRLKETDEDVPYLHGDFLYYSRTVEGLAYRIHCRKRGQEGTEEILLDENDLAKGHEYSVVSDRVVSPDHGLMAFSWDTVGNEHYLLRIKDLQTGQLLPDSVDEISGTIVWGGDNKIVFYTKLDDESRPFELFAHVLGTPSTEDVLLYREEDQNFWMDIGKTQNDAFFVMNLGSKETSECHIIDLKSLTVAELTQTGEPTQKQGEDIFQLTQKKDKEILQLIEGRRFGHRYEIEAHGNKFLIITNKDNAKCSKICTAPIKTPGEKHWVDVKPYDPLIQIDSVTPFRDYVVISGRQHGLEKIWTAPAAKLSDWSALHFPEPAYSVNEGANFEFNNDRVRLVFSSMVTPRRTFDYVFADKSIVTLKQQEVPNFDKELYMIVRTEVAARDGVNIPVSIVFQKSMLVDPSAPDKLEFKGGAQKLLLYGYGSYGACIDPTFDYKRITLLDHGIIYAIAHIRGGGEMGRPWLAYLHIYTGILHIYTTISDADDLDPLH